MESGFFYQDFMRGDAVRSGGRLTVASVREWERNEFCVNVRLTPEGEKMRLDVTTDDRVADSDLAERLGKQFLEWIDILSSVPPQNRISEFQEINENERGGLK